MDGTAQHFSDQTGTPGTFYTYQVYAVLGNELQKTALRALAVSNKLRVQFPSVTSVTEGDVAIAKAANSLNITWKTEEDNQTPPVALESQPYDGFIITRLNSGNSESFRVEKGVRFFSDSTAVPNLATEYSIEAYRIVGGEEMKSDRRVIAETFPEIAEVKDLSWSTGTDSLIFHWTYPEKRIDGFKNPTIR